MTLFDQPVALFGTLLVSLLIAVEVGAQLGQRLSVTTDELRHEQLVAARDAIGLLLSLLLGFTLAMALSRFDQRKQLVVDEANAIGTTILRAEMLPDPVRANMRRLLRDYVDARLRFAQAAVSGQEFSQASDRAKTLQGHMWQQSVEVAKTTPNAITSLFIQALNDSIDLGEKRLAMLDNRVPQPIWIMLTSISLLGCVTVGMSVRRRFWYVMMISPLMISIVMALIADLNSPRSGFLQTGQASLERLQKDLQASSSFH
jgi:Protein of unknown function (DUF4239)